MSFPPAVRPPSPPLSPPHPTPTPSPAQVVDTPVASAPLEAAASTESATTLPM
jgi:hypothetical protein